MTRKQKWIPFLAVSLVVTAVLAVFTATTHAQSAATITADRDTLTVGDPVILTVSVTHPAESVVLFPELDAHWGDFIVRSQSAPETTASGSGTAGSGTAGSGTAVTSQQIDARLFTPGDFQTPPLSITISDSAGNLSETIAPSLALTVHSVLVAGDNELRDIKPQANLPLPAVWPYLLAGLAIMAAIVGLVVHKRRTGRTAVDNRLPHEKALAALAVIDKKGYVAHGRYKEQYAAVSDTLRTYFEAITPVRFTDRTTAEIRYDLAAGPLPLGEAQRLLLLLEDADWVKFAKVTPSPHEAERLAQDARQLILHTKPEPTTEETTKKSGRQNKGGGRKSAKRSLEVTA